MKNNKKARPDVEVRIRRRIVRIEVPQTSITAIVEVTTHMQHKKE
jgi:hypothetical protein